MKRHLAKRCTALLCLLLIGALILSGALAEPVEAAVAEEPAISEEPQEASSVELEPEFEELESFELYAVESTDDAVPSDTGDDDGQTVPEDPDAVSGYTTRRFSETLASAAGTWKDLNLVREEGFTGKLAKVNGRLVLDNVLFEGAPAREVNLFDYFSLKPKASIVIGDDADLTLDVDALSINKGSTRTMNLCWKGETLPAKRASWTSSDAEIVTVNESGKISAKAKGSACITASYRNRSVVCRVSVTDIIYVSSIKVASKITLSMNHSTTLKVTVNPSNATNKVISWSSSNPSIATVDENGKVFALKKGTVTIKATSSNGKTSQCKVTVKVYAPKALDFRKLYVTLHPGKTYRCKVDWTPANTSNQKMTYTSNNPEVATVDENGLITALSCGTATIKARSVVNKNVVNSCKVRVIEEGAPQLEGVVIGINPGHQTNTIKKTYPIAPGSRSRAKGVKTGAGGRVTHQAEYEVVLQVGLKLKRILEENGATVYITRTSNHVNLTNIQRAEYLNSKNVDLALQLHCNSCSNSSKTGSSGYIRTANYNNKIKGRKDPDWVAESRSMAYYLCKNMSKYTGFKNRGVKVYNDYMSLNWTTTPSVLLEMGYLSNASDDRNLAKDSFREKLAYGIYMGICEYFCR